MNDMRPTVTRYFLGELPESERDELERRYFEDPGLFELAARVEAALVDDYARGRLDEETRRRFEAFYLAHPERRERAGFAAALAARIDRMPLARRGLAALLDGLGGPRPALALAMASLLIVSGVVWRASLVQRPGDGAPPPSPTVPPGPAPEQVVSLVIAVDPDVRGVPGGSPTTLVLPPATAEVRLVLGLREAEYATYRVRLRPIGGEDLADAPGLAPVAGAAGPEITLTLPAALLAAGDHLLLVEGATADGAADELSRTLLRVERP